MPRGFNRPILSIFADGLGVMGGWGIIPQYCQGGPVFAVVSVARFIAWGVLWGVVVTLMAGHVRGPCGPRSWAS